MSTEQRRIHKRIQAQHFRKTTDGLVRRLATRDTFYSFWLRSGRRFPADVMQLINCYVEYGIMDRVLPPPPYVVITSYCVVCPICLVITRPLWHDSPSIVNGDCYGCGLDLSYSGHSSHTSLPRTNTRHVNDDIRAFYQGWRAKDLCAWCRLLEADGFLSPHVNIFQ